MSKDLVPNIKMNVCKTIKCVLPVFKDKVKTLFSLCKIFKDSLKKILKQLEED